MNMLTSKKCRMTISIFIASMVLITGCADDAEIAKNNVAKAADNFEVMRRIVFYNTWTDTNMMVIEGKCSITYASRVSVICKTGAGPTDVKNSLISLNGQVTVFVEQLESTSVSFYHYRRTFKPQSIIPDIDFRGDGSSFGFRDDESSFGFRDDESSVVDAVVPDSKG